MLISLFQVADLLLRVLSWLIIASAIFSLLFAFNVLNYSNSGLKAFTDGLDRLLAPLYRPFRRILPRTGNVDWAPFALLVTIWVLQILLRGVAAEIAV